MAKKLPAAIGIDLGRYAHKAVLLHRRGAQLELTHYAVREIERPATDAESLTRDLKSLLAALGASAKAIGVATSSDDAILRIISQPETPREMLRSAIRLNGQTLLNQDVKDYVLDCALIPAVTETEPGRRKYLVGGLRRSTVDTLHEVFSKERLPLQGIQLAPVSTLNAFEFANPKTFGTDAFLLVDIGHDASVISVGIKKELILVRVLEYGGRALVEALARGGATEGIRAIDALEDGDEDLAETARISLSAITREITSSIGYFEGRREESVSRVFVSGGTAGSRAVLQIMAEELRMPCLAWNPLEGCQIGLPDERATDFAKDLVNLHAACGAAIELLADS
jgi:type IV pilus assembly protein PilM